MGPYERRADPSEIGDGANTDGGSALSRRLRDARTRVSLSAHQAAALGRAAAAVVGAHVRTRAGIAPATDLSTRSSGYIFHLVHTSAPLEQTKTPLHGFDLGTIGLGRRVAVALCLPASGAPPAPPWLTLGERMHDAAAHHHIGIADTARIARVKPGMFFRATILCASENASALRRATRHWSPRPIVIVDREGEPFREQVDRARQLVLAGILEDLAPPLGAAELWRALATRRDVDDIAVVEHLTCLPNRLVLESAGFRPHLMSIDEAKAEITAHAGDQGAATLDLTLLGATTDAANTVLAERRRASTLFRKVRPELPEAISLILAVPGLQPEWYTEQGRPPRNADLQMSAMDAAVRIAQRQRGYATHIPPSVVARPALFEEVQKHQQLRGAELELFSAAVGAVAVRYSAPVVRLPFGVNNAQSAIGDLETNVRRGEGGSRGARKNIAVVEKLVDELHRSVASPAIELFLRREPLAHVKLVADAPLEWLALDGLPLFLRHSTSRLPATPGHLLLDAALNHQLVNLKFRDLRRVLVLRSFESSFPARLALEEAVRAAIASPLHASLIEMRESSNESTRARLADFADDVELQVVDVRTEGEVIAALNAFAGWVVMFDCHGALSERTGQGELVIGADRLNSWSLRHRARVPPVVLLSACDTFILRGSSASIASGFLFSGALAVLGTLFEIDAMHAARFAASVVNICCRVGPMVAAASATPTRLSSLLTWAQRHVHLSDMVDAHRSFSKKPTPTLDELLHPLTLAAISDYAWEQPIITSISEKLGVTRDEFVRATHRTTGMLGPALQYLQLGSPEAIVIEGPGEGLSEAMTRWRRDFDLELWRSPPTPSAPV